MHGRRPKILFLSPNWPADKAFGGQMRASHIGRALREIGDVTLTVVSSDPGSEENLRKAAAEGEVTAPVIARATPNRGLNQKLRWAFDSKYLNVHGCTASLADQQRISSYLGKYDLVWVLNSRLPNLLQRWAWPHAHLDVDDVPSTYLRAVVQNGRGLVKRWKARAQQSLLKRRENQLLRRFTTISVCSQDDREYLGSSDRIHVIPNGFQRPTSTPIRNLVPGQPRIGFIGLYSYPPNVNSMGWFLQECWPQVRKEIPGIRLRLIGKDTDGPLKPKDPDVDALGWVADPAAEIATWSAMIVPIRFGAGTRIKIAEAFSRMVPAVSTSLGAYGYEIVHRKHLMLADDPKEFTAACVEMVRNPTLAGTIAQNAWNEFLTKWTWDAITPKIWGAAEDCLRRSKS